MAQVTLATMMRTTVMAHPRATSVVTRMGGFGGCLVTMTTPSRGRHGRGALVHRDYSSSSSRTKVMNSSNSSVTGHRYRDNLRQGKRCRATPTAQTPTHSRHSAPTRPLPCYRQRELAVPVRKRACGQILAGCRLRQERRHSGASSHEVGKTAAHAHA